ncbi:MAG: type II 3-dehydroquinate dehydratase [Ruminococcus sp.]|jgi:3-dehydroquinate dehydratase-2|nr:type II 3-dehydroquinate dehydratase [Ruminococcus sp.]
MNILILNGPNLNLVGEREPNQYGLLTMDKIIADAKDYAEKAGHSVDYFQSNHEGEIIDKIHSARTIYDGIVLNAGALAHYSYAVRDAIKAICIPVVEVHMSNIQNREEFRKTSVIASVCVGVISGFSGKSYILGIAALSD